MSRLADPGAPRHRPAPDRRRATRGDRPAADRWVAPPQSAIRAQAPRRSLRQAAQRPDRLARAEQAALFQDVAKQHHDRQDRRGHQVAGGPGGDQGQRDQPVGDAVQAGMPQALPRRAQHRHRHRHRRHAGDQSGERRVGGKREFPTHRDQQQPSRQHGQRQPQPEQ